jgi:hypothetical protein
MSQPPDRPKLYHITHVDNLSSISKSGVLFSDAEIIRTSVSHSKIGMSAIKARRLNELEVKCHPGTKVGEYVPFYFCPRSIMLYLLHRGNHPDVLYASGQEPIIHLEADAQEVVQWADSNGVQWAFSDRNAGTRYASFYRDLNHLNRIDWNAVEANDFRDLVIKEGKQAEFLVYDSFPWALVRRVGVRNQGTADQAKDAVRSAKHQPVISVESGWYF